MKTYHLTTRQVSYVTYLVEAETENEALHIFYEEDDGYKIIEDQITDEDFIEIVEHKKVEEDEAC
tara:strand:- start:364 stop:558 length:195 start_codon:yes stop_codon:yes gene_type:complete